MIANILDQELPAGVERDAMISQVELSIAGYSPVLGRWRTEIEPRSNVFLWMSWNERDIAVALTAMCLPFYVLRPCEFNEKLPGKHLKDLNLRYNSVSSFVCTSILLASVLGKRDGVQVLEKWLAVARELHTLRNYHMLFAVQNAFHMHQVDRCTFLFKKLSKANIRASPPPPPFFFTHLFLVQSAKATLKTIDTLFATSDRMKVFKAELTALVGKEPVIPCVFWLVQKGTLLQETPLLLDTGALNPQRIAATVNVFADLEAMQAKRYAPLKEQEQITWYLMRLERDVLCTQDELYILSDAAIKASKRIQLGKTASKLSRKASAPAGAGRMQSVPSSPVRKASESASTMGTVGRKGSDSSIVPSSGDSDAPSSGPSSHDSVEDEFQVMSVESILAIAQGNVSGKSDASFINNMSAVL